MSGWDYVGVDRSSGSWVAVGYGRTDRPSVAVSDGFREFWEDVGEGADRIVVDVPIGLFEGRDAEDGTELSRRCDELARTAIGDRRSSVFTPPCREAAALAFEGADYSEVNETNMDVTGKGLTKQAANISDGIHEVDTFLRSHEDARDIVVEGHPVVCFRAFNGAPLQFSKRTVQGIEERLSAIDRVGEFDERDWRHLAADLRVERRGVGFDDLLDAIALALTACAKRGVDEQSLPPDPPKDQRGLPMQMVYRSEMPFEL